jgi:glycosyltransferase involved in cell wall biosynthesis
MDGRLKVLCLMNKLTVGGHECGRLTLAKMIDRSRFDYRFLTITQTPDLSDEELIATAYLKPRFKKAGFPVESLGQPDSRSDGTRGRLRVLGAAFGMLRSIRRLVKYIRENRIEVIDAHHTSAMFAASIAGWLTGVPVVLTAYHLAAWNRPAMSLPGQLTFGLASAVITDSEIRREEMRKWGRKKSLPIEVVPTGIFPPAPVTPAAEMRKQIGLPDDPDTKVVGMIAAFMEFKGHEDLLDAAIEVCRKEPSVVFLCQGPSRGQTEYEDRLRRRIEEVGLQDRFFLRMASGEIGDVWQLFDIFAHPTRFDSLPCVVMEAMALRKPSVVTDIGGIPEVVEHESTGLVVPPRNPSRLAESLLRLLRNPTEANQLAEAAYGRYEKSLSPEEMARRIERIFIRVTNRETLPIEQAEKTRDAA